MGAMGAMEALFAFHPNALWAHTYFVGGWRHQFGFEGLVGGLIKGGSCFDGPSL
jgi:hypothetical protein